jgi:hypothetical protein
MKVGGDATRGSHTDYQQLFTAVILQQTSPSAAHLQVSVHAAGACEAGSAWRLAGVCRLPIVRCPTQKLFLP